MTEKEWVKTHTTGFFKDYDPDVVAFIGEILYDGRNQEDALRSFFRAGYCYHFARLLQDVFKRGTLCVTEPFGHIVWMDTNGLAYDIEGPYLPEEQECTALRDIKHYGDLILDYIHHPGKTFRAPEFFSAWAEHRDMTDSEAVLAIWDEMPKDDLPEEYDIVTEVLAYWNKHRDSLELTEREEWDT